MLNKLHATQELMQHIDYLLPWRYDPPLMNRHKEIEMTEDQPVTHTLTQGMERERDRGGKERETEVEAWREREMECGYCTH